MRKIYVFCFAKRSENHAKRFAFLFDFACSEKKFKRKRDTLMKHTIKTRFQFFYYLFQTQTEQIFRDSAKKFWRTAQQSYLSLWWVRINYSSKLFLVYGGYYSWEQYTCKELVAYCHTIIFAILL
jgi:hypothetical protein